MGDDFAPILEEIDFAIAEMAVRPTFKIVHRFHRPPSICLPGEETAAIVFVHHAREFVVPLSLAQRLMFDYLGHSRLPQTASQIEAGIAIDPYYTRHGANAGPRGKQIRKIGRASIKVYVERIRMALRIVFGEAGVDLDPYKILASEPTTGNQLLYQLRARIDWFHVS